MIREIAKKIHQIAASAGQPYSGAYLSSFGALSRGVFPHSWAQRVRNSICDPDVAWPPIELAQRDVRVGQQTHIKLVPHLGEFDVEALFVHELNYEYPVFLWLEENAAERYHSIIEIGANVGIYTCFFEKLSQKPRSSIGRIVSFEPSRAAFERLSRNIRNNRVKKALIFNIAVGIESGFVDFFEPEGHLTNGSLKQNFAEIFSPNVEKHTALAIAADQLAVFLDQKAKNLIKIDVEGFEPVLLPAIAKLIANLDVDLMVEILPGTPDCINTFPWNETHDFFLLTDTGAVSHSRCFADERHRDWVLIRKTS
jgi:FkbM family methyltransferase